MPTGPQHRTSWGTADLDMNSVQVIDFDVTDRSGKQEAEAWQ